MLGIVTLLACVGSASSVRPGAFKSEAPVTISVNSHGQQLLASERHNKTGLIAGSQPRTPQWAVRIFVVGSVTPSTARILLELGPHTLLNAFCSQDTGGTCKIRRGCYGWRNSQCRSGVCSCSPAHCATFEGECVKNPYDTTLPPAQDLPSPSTPLVVLRAGETTVQHEPLDATMRHRLGLGLSVALVFQGLRPDTRYSAFITEQLKAPTWLQGAGSVGGPQVRTSPTEGSGAALKIGALSCNKAMLIGEGVIKANEDLWDPLSKHAPHMHALIHAGDDVYVDADRGKYPHSASPTERCVWCRWEEFLKDKDGASWDGFRGEIAESMRDLYRSVWGREHIAKTLASVPNYFVPDDHELRDDWGDKTKDRDKTSLQRFIGDIAWQVAQEYEMQANRDVPFTQEGVANGRPDAFSSHVVGDVGIIMLDVRVAPVFDWRSSEPQDEKYLGSVQWSWLREKLGGSAGPSWGQVKALVVVSPVPLVYFTENTWKLASRVVDDAEGMWQSARTEQANLLDLLLQWQNSMPGRRVLNLAGDVHHGGWTEIAKSGTKAFNQLITSPIANHPMPWLAVKGFWLVLKPWTNSLENGFSFEHKDFIAERNYGVVDYELTPEGHARLNAALHTSDENFGTHTHTFA